MANFKMIDMATAKNMMSRDENFVIVDVRSASEYEAGFIPGAINVALESIGAECPKELPDRDQEILVYCRSGVRSKMAAEKLANLGYSNVYEFGGIINWDGEVEVDY
ncbi:rhodanese domain protein [Lachnospiraceae bacterium KM106-2]|nr:rhodanese domain protein [Lachnospiraceae bacterium KM106-2]